MYWLYPIDPAFNPFEARTFKAACNFEAGDEGHVYEDNVLTENTFTTSQLLSIQLYDAVTAFNISTEAHRVLAGIMNTIIRDHDKLMQGINNKLASVKVDSYIEL